MPRGGYPPRCENYAERMRIFLRGTIYFPFQPRARSMVLGVTILYYGIKEVIARGKKLSRKSRPHRAIHAKHPGYLPAVSSILQFPAAEYRALPIVILCTCFSPFSLPLPLPPGGILSSSSASLIVHGISVGTIKSSSTKRNSRL